MNYVFIWGVICTYLTYLWAMESNEEYEWESVKNAVCTATDYLEL